MGPGVVLLEADGLPARGDGLVQKPFVPQVDGEVVVDLGPVLLETNGLPVLGDGLVEKSLAA